MILLSPHFVFYACIAKGTTILAEFNSKDVDLGVQAAKCLEKIPLLHSVFSQTIRNKTYTFMIDDPFAYFGIFDANLEKSEGLFFLKSVNDSFNEILDCNPVRRLDAVHSYCFQGEFNPIFHQLLAPSSEMEVPHSPRVVLKQDSCGSLDSPRWKKLGSINASKSLKKKKNSLFGGTNSPGKNLLRENEVDVSIDDVVFSREIPVLFAGDAGHEKAKQVWKKQVWVLLSLDLVVCSMLVMVWLWICRGIECIAE